MNPVKLSLFRACRFLRRGLRTRWGEPLGLEDRLIIRHGWRKTLGCQQEIVHTAAKVMQAARVAVPKDRDIAIDVNIQTRIFPYFPPHVPKGGIQYKVAASFIYKQRHYWLPKHIILF